ncbi:helix-turn-helix domain-containing protein [Demequina sp. TTPB684]|uniref:AlkA N-terminal domain-containing protein n=1 Tax=unclassified Demequina TaxID=2620311 RepID=UPI001CF16C73|nr:MULTISPECIES: AlkA N-terminal domain-containing protein [unclassified Demequina]MCB2412878.1 helix-turn-helix domain-containing protein [Demequina sp. TTPB684]UPU88145.1 helix-turn-helix domain-containing protein [Demequina sp. TMPB413]
MTATMLDAHACYRASSGRDRRFDGQFVMAVRTTGIYCRPSCPARTPKPHNVEFFRTSAAAHVAGYRACKRCLPEAVPGSPEWNVREDTAARAMRLIADGVVDRSGVPALAARLGYSTRQLTRLLTEELGAGPLALARAQRAHNARHLLVSTLMPAGDVAFAAGFSSIRQFNDTIGEVFGMTPTALRERARKGEAHVAGSGVDTPGAVTVRLAAREPFDGAGVLRWLATRALDGTEHASESHYTRSLRLDRGAAVVAIAVEPGAVRVTAHVEHLTDLPALLTRTRRLLDLDADPDVIDAALAAHPLVAPAVATRPGVRIPGTFDPTEMVVRAILGQQVSVAAARTAAQGLVTSLAEPLPAALAGGPVTALFPSATALADTVFEVVRGPHARRVAVARACEAIASGAVSLDIGATRADLTAQLEALPGVGPWTSSYVAMRVLGSPDILLTGDSAARAGAKALGLPGDPNGLKATAAPLSPWRSYLMMHLWNAAVPSPSTPGED